MSYTNDVTNSKTKLWGRPVMPPSGGPAVSSVQLWRRLSPSGAWSSLLNQALVVATTATGLAYRALPLTGLGRNQVVNGATTTAHGWTLHANAAVVTDATAVTGTAVRLIATATSQDSTQDLAVEPLQAYSFAAQMRSDGTMTGKVLGRWLDSAGTQIGADLAIASATATAWTEYSLTNQTAPGNARTLRVVLSSTASGVAFFTALRAVRQAGAPAAWTSAQQQFAQRGASIYEAATNLLVNGDVETALAGTVDGFNDPYASLNAWTTVSGAPSLAANVVTLNGASTKAGHADWWDWDGASQFRFQWVTGGTASLYVRYIDANNWVRFRADGTNFHVDKKIAGATTSDVSAQQAAALVNGTFYWFVPTITGTAFSCLLKTDNAGAPNTTSATIGATTIADAAVANGLLMIEGTGGAIAFGGNFASVARVKIAAPPSWAVQDAVGVSAYCVSKLTKFTGTYSLSITANNAANVGLWSQLTNTANGQAHTLSARMKTVSVATAARVRWSGVGTFNATAVTGTTDWTADVLTFTADAATGTSKLLLAGVGTAYWDLVWLAQQAYDGGNADPTGQAFSSGARAAASLIDPLPAAFSIADMARTVAVRPDHLYTRGGTRVIWSLYVDANNSLKLYIDAAGNITFEKKRAGVTSTVTDAAATAFAALDTLAIGVRHSASVGLELQVAKNGAAAVTYTTASAEAKIPTSGTPTSYIGRDSAAGSELCGTIGADRFHSAALSGTTLGTYVAAPYGDPLDTDLAVWGFDSQVYALPVYDDRLIKLGTAYDYRWDTTGGSPSVSQQGSPFTTTTTAGTSAWWLRSAEDATKDVNFLTLNEHRYKVSRPAQVVEPASGGLPSLIYTGTIGGIAGQLDILGAYTTSALQVSVEAAFRAILGSNDTIYLQTPFGGLFKVRFPAGQEFAMHETVLDVKLDTIEVA